MFKLICGKDPIEAGVQDANGNWLMDKLADHIVNCEGCWSFTNKAMKGTRETLTSVRIVEETMMGLMADKVFAEGELGMLIDIYNSTALTPLSMDKSSLLLQVYDSFDLYPGVYEGKWGVKKHEVAEKISKLSEWQAACVQIWAVDFWRSGLWQREGAVRDYSQGKIFPSSVLQNEPTE